MVRAGTSICIAKITSESQTEIEGAKNSKRTDNKKVGFAAGFTLRSNVSHEGNSKEPYDVTGGLTNSLGFVLLQDEPFLREQ